MFENIENVKKAMDEFRYAVISGSLFKGLAQDGGMRKKEHSPAIELVPTMPSFSKSNNNN